MNTTVNHYNINETPRGIIEVVTVTSVAHKNTNTYDSSTLNINEHLIRDDYHHLNGRMVGLDISFGGADRLCKMST